MEQRRSGEGKHRRASPNTGPARLAWAWTWPLALLCGGAASRWMFSEARPESATSLGSLAVAAALAGTIAAGTAIRRRIPLPDGRAALRPAAAGVLLLGGPQAALLPGVRGIEPAGLLMALALTPVCAAVAWAALGEDATHGGTAGVTGRLWPGIAALAGLLLILPAPSLRGIDRDCVLIAVPVLTGLGAAWFCAGDPSDRAWTAACALLGGAVLFVTECGVEAMTAGRGAVNLSPFALALDTPLLLLSMLALVRSGVTRWSAQFTAVPLVVLLEGVFLMHEDLTGRSLAGLLLLAVASVALLLPAEPDDAPKRLTG